MNPYFERPRLIRNVALGLLALGVLAGIAVPAGLGWDFANFYDTGRRVWAGQLGDIYHPASLIAGRMPQGHMAFWGSPLSAFAYAPLAPLGPEAALILFKLVASVALGAALVLLYRQTRRLFPETGEARERTLALFLVLVLLFQPFWTIYRVGGQTTPLVLLLLVLGFGLHEQEHEWPAALCLAVASLLKPAFLLVPALLVLLSGRRTLLAVVGTYLALGLVSLVLLGWPIHREFIEVLLRGSRQPSPWFFNSSLSILANPMASGDGSGAGLLGIKLAVLAAFVAIALARRRSPLAGAGRRRVDYLLAVSFALLLSQVVWEHYLTVLFLPLAFLVAARRALPAAARGALWAIFVLCCLQNLVLVLWVRDHLAVSSGPGLYLAALVKSGPLLLTLYWLLRYHRVLFAVIGTAPVREAPAGEPAAPGLVALPAEGR